MRLTVDTSQPLAFGMPKSAIAFVSGGQAFDVNLAPAYNRDEREVKVAARFAAKDLLASGYLARKTSWVRPRCWTPASEAATWCCSLSARSFAASRSERSSSY